MKGNGYETKKVVRVERGAKGGSKELPIMKCGGKEHERLQESS